MRLRHSHHTHMKILQFKSAQKEKFNNLIAYHILTLLDFLSSVLVKSSNRSLFLLCESWWENLIPSLIFGVRIYFFSRRHNTACLLRAHTDDVDDSCNLIIVWVEKFPFEKKRSRHAFKHEIPKNCDMWRAIIRKKHSWGKFSHAKWTICKQFVTIDVIKSNSHGQSKEFLLFTVEGGKNCPYCRRITKSSSEKGSSSSLRRQQSNFLTVKSITLNWIENISMCDSSHNILKWFQWKEVVWESNFRWNFLRKRGV